VFVERMILERFIVGKPTHNFPNAMKLDADVLIYPLVVSSDFIHQDHLGSIDHKVHRLDVTIRWWNVWQLTHEDAGVIHGSTQLPAVA